MQTMQANAELRAQLHRMNISADKAAHALFMSRRTWFRRLSVPMSADVQADVLRQILAKAK